MLEVFPHRRGILESTMRSVAWRDSGKQGQGRERIEENEQEDPGEVI